MPEFVLNTGNIERIKWYNDRTEFVRGYIAAAFWTDAREGASLADVELFDLEAMRTDCDNFLCVPSVMLALGTILRDTDTYDMEQAGADFWLTRNRHGAGYWDRDLPDAEAKALTDAAVAEGTAYLPGNVCEHDEA